MSYVTGRRTVPAVAALLSLALCASSTSARADDCVRHFYNHSNQPWSFKLGFSGQGNADYRGCSGPNNPSEYGACRVAPGHTASYSYYQQPIEVRITDGKGVTHSFGFGSRFIPGNCNYVTHSGNTGAVAVNDPADGDFNAGSDNW